MLEAKGLLVGVLDEVDCPAETISVEPGDLLLLYTDGIVECWRSDGAFFGPDRLVGALVAHGKSEDASAAQILDGILEEVFSFLGDRPQSDDMTAVVLKVMATRGR